MLQHPSGSAVAPSTPTEPSSSPSLVWGNFLFKASQSQLGKAAHLDHTQLLNKYMPRLLGKCLFHFILEEKLVPNHFPSCQYILEQSSKQEDYNTFRQLFQFTKFEYCSFCEAPQNQQRDREFLEFYVSLTFGKYGYNHVLFRMVFCIWQTIAL